MQALSLGLRAPYRLKRWVTLLAQASLRLDFTKGGPLDSRVTFTRASGGTSFRPVGYGPNLVTQEIKLLQRATEQDLGGGVWKVTTSGDTDPFVEFRVPTGLLNGRVFECTAEVWTDAGQPTSFELYSYSDYVTEVQNKGVVLATVPQVVSLNRIFSSTNGKTLFSFRLDGVNAPSSGNYFYYRNVVVREIFLDRPGDPIQLFTAPVNVPRFDYDPVTRQCKGLLIEEQRTNSFDNSEAQTYGAGSTANGLSFEKVGEGYMGTARYTDIRVSGVATATYLDVLLSFRDGGVPTTGVVCSVTCGVLAAALPLPPYRAIKIVDYASGWAAPQAVDSPITDMAVGDVRRRSVFKAARADRVVVNFVLSMSAYPGQAYDFVLRLSMPQLEAGAFPTSYIPTNGAAATRAADLPSVNTLTPWFNSVEGTWFAEFRGGLESSQGGYGRAISAGGSDSIISREGANRVGTWDLSTAIQSPFGGPDPAFAVVRAAVAIAAASRSICLGGGLVSSGAHSGRFLGMSKLEIGSSGGGNFLNGHIRRIAYIPRRMSNLDLQGLTR